MTHRRLFGQDSKWIFHVFEFFYFYLLIFEGFPNRVLVYPDRGGLQIMLMICTNKLCQCWWMWVSAKEKCDVESAKGKGAWELLFEKRLCFWTPEVYAFATVSIQLPPLSINKSLNNAQFSWHQTFPRRLIFPASTHSFLWSFFFLSVFVLHWFRIRLLIPYLLGYPLDW